MTLAEQLSLLTRNVEAVIPKDGLEKKLSKAASSKKPLIVKLGLDPTAPDIHLGHTVVLRKLREFQDLGHKVVLIVGDFTAKIGDPSGKSQTRPTLSSAEIKSNAATYKKQVLKVLDAKKTELRFNSEWLGKLKADDVLKLLAKVTTAQILARDDFHQRTVNGQAIGLHELLYPLLQAQDSVAIKADIELGGTDQTFNMLMGRELQEGAGQEPQVVITMPLIPGLDGKQKMSKSLGNYIGILESASDMYGKVMSIPDSLILPYMRLLTTIPENDIPKSEKEMEGMQMQLKQKLAIAVTSMYTSEKDARAAQEKFRATFQNREFPKDAQKLVLKIPTTLLTFVTEVHKLFPSKSEARRKIAEGAIEIDGQKIKDGMTQIQPPAKGDAQLKIGKKGFYRITRQ